MDENPYQSPKELTEARQSSSPLRRPLWAFWITTACFAVINVAIVPTLNSKSGAGFLPLCVVNAPAMPVMVAVMAVVSLFGPPGNRKGGIETLFVAVLAVFGPVLWGSFAAYVTWRIAKLTAKSK